MYNRLVNRFVDAYDVALSKQETKANVQQDVDQQATKL